MQHPTCTVPTDATRTSKLVTVLEMLGVYAILASMVLIAYFVGQGTDLRILITFLAGLTLVPVCGIIAYWYYSRQIIRVSPTGIQVRNLGPRKSHKVAWEDISACSLSSGGFGVQCGQMKHLYFGKSFKKEEWQQLRSVVEHYFDYLFRDHTRLRAIAQERTAATEIGWRIPA